MSEDTDGKKFKLKAKKAAGEASSEEPTIEAKPTKELKSYDVASYNKLVEDVKKATLSQYAMKCHQELKQATILLKGEKGSYKLSDVNDLLVNYPSNFAWSIIAAELLKAHLEEMKDESSAKGMLWYKEAEGKLEKATVKAIEAEVYSEHTEEIDESKKLIRDFESKVAIAQGMVKVWGNAVNTMQSLSKNIVAEIEMAKSRLK